jgi:uncharacterized protein with HEPN domain
MPTQSTQDNDRYRIGHMIEFCEKLAELANTISEEILEDDWVYTFAVMQLYEMLGEAASKVSNELKMKYPEIPWRDITDLRNRLIHGYDDTEHHLLWLAMENDVPPLLEQLYQVQQDFNADRLI